MKEYRQTVHIGGDELEAVWVHEPQSDIPEHWTLKEVDGWDESSCPDEIWIAADSAFNPAQMEEIDDRDFESIIEEQREAEIWSVK